MKLAVRYCGEFTDAGVVLESGSGETGNAAVTSASDVRTGRSAAGRQCVASSKALSEDIPALRSSCSLLMQDRIDSTALI